ncbi:MAG: hypothetical protein HOW73_21220 [Polyangiaceae bacterium]|nr:hypothetical protein [Polyangiaceae bacterium]
MTHAEIHRLALLATMKITFVATLGACGQRETPPDAPNSGRASAPVTPSPSTSCASGEPAASPYAAETPARTSQQPSTPAPAAAPATSIASNRAPASRTRVCGATEAVRNGNPSPSVKACCEALLTNTDWTTTPIGEAQACCRATGSMRGICAPWGPPPPPAMPATWV